ncbi:MAG: carbon monoxide dehydrogenase [Alphaproteobacteria bacterium]|nr:carbon monoxide dehydrogenase [Alphaproteobacteria bacterium]
MDMTGQHRIAARRGRVWAALNDPAILQASIPGCEELVKASESEFTAKVRAKVGPVSAAFTGKVTLADLNPPESYTISGEGQGGVAGFARGGAEVRLEEDGDGTILHYKANGTVGGKLAQIGSRLIDATARKMAEDFFTRFAAQVEQQPDDPPAPKAASEPAQPGAQPAASPTAAPAPGIPMWAWVGGLMAFVVILLFVLNR